MLDEIAVQALDRHQAVDILEELADLYVRVYAEPPYDSAPKFGRDRFLDRTRRQTLAPGFALITARRRGELVAFSFGLTMTPGAWWANASAPPDEIVNAAKFAVIELVVERSARGHGIGRALLDGLLTERPETCATLAAVIDADAYSRYLRWGWEKVAEFRVEPPYSDALVLALPPGKESVGG